MGLISTGSEPKSLLEGTPASREATSVSSTGETLLSDAERQVTRMSPPRRQASFSKKQVAMRETSSYGGKAR